MSKLEYLFASRAVLKAVSVGSVPVLLACANADVRACQERFGTAQQSVLSVDPKASESVAKSLSAVESALTMCKTAHQDDAVHELSKAKNELIAQRDLLERRARRKPRAELLPEDLRKLEKEGDPSCPRGQAYRHAGSKEIRCTGPQLIEMNAREVRAYFEERDYRIRTASPATLDIEHGSERILFVYGTADSDAPPSCVKIFPPPEVTWQESLARATGANPARLKTDGTLESARGAVPYRVDEKNSVIRIGQCAP